jgi:Flp pilus assembly CpaF family ATPase
MTPQAEPTVRAVAQTLNVEQAAEITQSDVIRQTLRRYEASAD